MMFYENRPKLKIKPTETDKIIQWCIVCCLLFCIVYPAIHYSNLPERVPMHFNYKGEVDGYGSKSSVWGLAIIAIIISYGMHKLNQHPHWFNYSVKITKENAEKNYRSAQKMLLYVILCCALLFALITYQVITIALNANQDIANWLMYLIYIILGLITFVPIIIVFIGFIKTVFIKDRL